LDGTEESLIEGLVLGGKEGCTLSLGDTEGILDGMVERSNVGIPLFASVGTMDACRVGAKEGKEVGKSVGVLDGFIVLDGTLDDKIEGLTDGCVDNIRDGLLDGVTDG